MLLTLALLVVGIALLLGGGQALVRGATTLAKAAGIPPLLIGLTVVAFGTSTPELSVNLTGVLAGQGGISFGNVVGSNLANIGLILGTAALVRPIVIKSQVIVRGIPMMLLATAAFAVMSFDATLRGEPGMLDRTDGLVLLLFFSVFIYTEWQSMRRARTDPLLQQSADIVPADRRRRLGWSIVAVAVGVVALVGGGALTVDNAAKLGNLLGIPPAAIAFSMVAIGTSLPELVTSVIAARQGETDLAVGNVVGSNIFNLLFIMGLTSTTRPVQVPPGGLQDLMALVAASLLLLPVCLTYRRRIVRMEGTILLLLWLIYTIWRLAPAQ